MSRRLPTSASTRSRGRAVLAAATGVACVAALAVAPASAATDDRPSALPRIKGHVGPGFEISINKASVPAGRYKLIVKDEGTIHNFHILGTGVDKATGIPETGTFKFRIRLSPGTYQIQCDQHSASMNTTLTVT